VTSRFKNAFKLGQSESIIEMPRAFRQKHWKCELDKFIRRRWPDAQAWRCLTVLELAYYTGALRNIQKLVWRYGSFDKTLMRKEK
jgi:hypothetical protein